MQPLSRHNLLLAGFLLLGGAVCDYNPKHCDELIIHSQADVDNAIGSKGCQVIDNDVVLASDATGEIALDGIDFISGALRNEKGSQVTAIRNEKIWEIDGDLLLRDMPKLQTVKFKELLTVGGWAGFRSARGKVHFENLPALSELDLWELNILGEFHAINLPLLKNIAQRDQTTGFSPCIIELRDIGMSRTSRLPMLYSQFTTSTHVNSVMMSNSHRGAEHGSSDGLKDIFITHNHTGNIDLALDGDAAVEIGSKYVDRATISGVSKLWVAGTSVEELVVRDSPRLTNISHSGVVNLDVQDCPAFERFGSGWGANLDSGLGNSWFDWTAPTSLLSHAVASRSLVLRNLTSMYLHPDTTHLKNATGHDWSSGYCKYGGNFDPDFKDADPRPSSRCMGNMTTVVLEGNITNDFFEDFLFAFWSRGVANSFWNSDAGKRIDIRGHGRVTERFEIASTDPSFNCTAMDELRDVGLFPGKYSCNGKTAPMTRDAWAEAEKRSAGGRGYEVAGGVLGLVMLLQLLLLL
ncbi:GPI-anchored cell wall organization protein-domain-containing protein [Apiospora arundinis]